METCPRCKCEFEYTGDWDVEGANTCPDCVLEVFQELLDDIPYPDVEEDQHHETRQPIH